MKNEVAILFRLRRVTVRKVEEMIEAEGRITIDSIETTIWCLYGLAYSIIHRKLYLWWVPRQFTEENKNNRMCLSVQHMFQYADEGEAMINKIVIEQ